MYYSTVFSIRQHKIADLATREGEPLPSPKGEGGPAGPDEGQVSGRQTINWQQRQVSPSSVTFGDSFSLRAKSRLRRLHSDTRLRAQPLGGSRSTRAVRSATHVRGGLGQAALQSLLNVVRRAGCPHPAAVSVSSRPRSALQTSSPSPAPPGRCSWGSCPAPRRQQ